MTLLSLVLQAVALTVVFVRGAIFRRLREGGPALWRELAGCPLCAGVWIGAGWRLAYALLVERAPTSTWLVMETLAAGAATGTIAFLVILLAAVLDKHS